MQRVGVDIVAEMRFTHSAAQTTPHHLIMETRKKVINYNNLMTQKLPKCVKLQPKKPTTKEEFAVNRIIRKRGRGKVNFIDDRRHLNSHHLDSMF